MKYTVRATKNKSICKFNKSLYNIKGINLCENNMNGIKNTVLMFLIGAASTLVSINSHAWGPTHYHGGGWGYNGPGYYGPGGYPGWGGPNVIINVPIIPVVPRAPYYVRECETVELCNEYDECWLERRCN